MERKITAALKAWKASSQRKPLVIFGARQTGKTTSVLAFGEASFAHCVHIDFIRHPEYLSAFSGGLSPDRIVSALSALTRREISPENTLLFFDEIQECPEALSSLKYFATDAPEYRVCAAGSLLGVRIARDRQSFPVGYVETLEMHPMDFEEFCWAMDEARVFAFVREAVIGLTPCLMHERMMNLYRDYLLVGGMPEAVLKWRETGSLPAVRKVQGDIRTGYVADIAKHAGNADAVKITACWESIPAQLAKESGSTKFVWKDVDARAKGATYRSAVDWLAAAGTIDLVTRVECMETPLKSFEDAASFKVYLADTGLLSCAYDATPADLEGKGPRTARFRGGVAENYVAQQLAAARLQHWYWGMQSRAEVEFVVRLGDFAVPIDAKSGTNTGAQSLRGAMEKYGLPVGVQVSGKNVGFSNGVVNVPLYAAGLIAELDVNRLVKEQKEAHFVRLPGLCDVHVHFREPGRTDKETIATGCAAALAGGYTTVCPMPNTTPVMDTPERLRGQLEIIARDAPIQVLPYASITHGEAGREVVDMEALSPLCVAFSDDGVGLNEAPVMREAMTRAAALGRVVAAHCEDKSLIPPGGCVNDCAFAREHGLPGISNESEWAPIVRDAALCEETGAAYHVCHVSTRESVEAVRAAKARGANITCEVTPHHLLMDDTMLPADEDGRFKMNPPLRSPEDREACVAGLLDGTIDFIATDHAPHTAEEKARGLAAAPFGIVGLETAFPLLYTHLVLPGLLSLERLVSLMSDIPRARFGIAEPGPDTYALWDLDAEYEIDAAAFAGKCKVSPFDGWRVRGRCMKVVFEGRVVYDITDRR